MTTKRTDRIVQPYLMFNGRSEEAIEFYKKALGAQVETLMRFKDRCARRAAALKGGEVR